MTNHDIGLSDKGAADCLEFKTIPPSPGHSLQLEFLVELLVVKKEMFLGDTESKDQNTIVLTR